ncbi:MAG: hypothetical protein ACXVB1_09575 [Pseudobdellovibrionaceae bacterium]
MHKMRNFLKSLTWGALVLFAFNAFAELPEDVPPNAMDLHAANCGQGDRGWWIKLDSQKYDPSVTGWISTTTGEYGGCGNCNDCRSKLNEWINNMLEQQRQICAHKGGETKAEDRGTWTEDVQSDRWTMRASRMGITCEKWIPCGN